MLGDGSRVNGTKGKGWEQIMTCTLRMTFPHNDSFLLFCDWYWETEKCSTVYGNRYLEQVLQPSAFCLEGQQHGRIRRLVQVEATHCRREESNVPSPVFSSFIVS